MRERDSIRLKREKLITEGLNARAHPKRGSILFSLQEVEENRTVTLESEYKALDPANI